jgi:hypothetical protein
MALPALLGAVLPSVVSGGLGLLNYFGNKPSKGSPNQPAIQQVPGQPQGNFLTGYSGYGQQFPRFSPEQQQALNQLLARGISSTDFGPIEQQARTQFQQRTVPTLAERFTSLGAGAQSSPAFARTLGEAGSQLEQNLAALRSQYALQQLRLGLTPLFENIYTPGREGAAGPLLQSAGQTIPALAQGLSSYLSPTMQQQSPPDFSAQLQQLLSQLTPDQIAELLGQGQQQDILAPIREKPKPNIWQLTQAASSPSALSQLLA